MRSPRILRRLALLGALGVFALLTPESRAGAGVPDDESVVWEEIPVTVAPPRTNDFSTEYDDERGVTWLVGKYGWWSWDGTRWSGSCSGPSCPPPPPTSGLTTVYKSLAYDRARKRVVSYAGEGLSEFDGTTTTTPCETAPCNLHVPPARSGSMLVYDSVRQRVVLFGGDGKGGGPLADVWEWDGAAWTERCTDPACVRPTARADAAAVFDDARGQLVLFGGNAHEGGWGRPMGILGDMWSWDGSAWTELCSSPACASKPYARWESSMAFDRTRRRVILFGGGNPDAEGAGPPFNDTWEWDGARWMVRSPVSAIPPNERGSLSWDARRRRAVLVQPGATTMRVWEYHTRSGTCSADGDCDTGHCVDGVCCETACGTCESCALAVPGECAKIKSAPDPDSCTGAFTCDRAGACLGAQGAACSDSSECASGFCADGMCCDRRCDQPCETCARARGATADGTCGLAPAGDPGRPVCGRSTCDGKSDACPVKCAVDADCAARFVCGTAHTCVRKGPCDDHVLTLDDGSTVDCFPNTCSADGKCRSSCESVRDCVAPTICDASGRCALPEGAAASSCDLGRTDAFSAGRGAAAALTLILGTIFVRRRRRSPS